MCLHANTTSMPHTRQGPGPASRTKHLFKQQPPHPGQHSQGAPPLADQPSDATFVGPDRKCWCMHRGASFTYTIVLCSLLRIVLCSLRPAGPATLAPSHEAADGLVAFGIAVQGRHAGTDGVGWVADTHAARLSGPRTESHRVALRAKTLGWRAEQAGTAAGLGAVGCHLLICKRTQNKRCMVHAEVKQVAPLHLPRCPLDGEI